MTRPVLALLLVVVAATAAGCGGDSARGPSPTPADQQGRPVTDDQALVLARLLEQNWQRRGATFTGKVDVRGITIPMAGRVNFRSGRGTATLREPSAAARRYVWTRDAVFAQSAPNSQRYMVQPADPENDTVHSAIAFINLLSAETIDNTANIQDQGARFLRSETLDGTPVDVYDYGENGRTTYWVDREDGMLRQVQATFADGGTLVLTLTAHEPQRIPLPKRHESA